jgi:hypothetical protein
MEDTDTKIKYRVKFTVPGFGWLVLLAFLVLVTFESEFKCSLGNKVECLKMEPKPKG